MAMSARTECGLGAIALSQSDARQAPSRTINAPTNSIPNEVQAQMGLARLLSMQEKPQEAIKYLRMAVQARSAQWRRPITDWASAYKRLQMDDEAQKGNAVVAGDQEDQGPGRRALPADEPIEAHAVQAERRTLSNRYAHNQCKVPKMIACNPVAACAASRDVSRGC